MRVELDRKGTLKITPENAAEMFALRYWMEHNEQPGEGYQGLVILPLDDEVTP